MDKPSYKIDFWNKKGEYVYTRALLSFGADAHGPYSWRNKAEITAQEEIEKNPDLVKYEISEVKESI